MDLHIVDLRDPTLTDAHLVSLYQSGNAVPTNPYSIVLFKGIEDAMQYRTMLNPRLKHTTLLNVLDGPFASTSGHINIITCSNFDHFKLDTTSIDALLRSGRIAKQVEFPDVLELSDMFAMMLGTSGADGDQGFAPSDLLLSRLVPRAPPLPLAPPCRERSAVTVVAYTLDPSPALRPALCYLGPPERPPLVGISIGRGRRCLLAQQYVPILPHPTQRLAQPSHTTSRV